MVALQIIMATISPTNSENAQGKRKKEGGTHFFG
jgi:hypothetical protein